MSEWISVDDSFPEKDTETCSIDCWFFTKKRGFGVGYLYLDAQHKGSAFNYIDRSNYEVTHWMPLPEAPDTEGMQ